MANYIVRFNIVKAERGASLKEKVRKFVHLQDAFIFQRELVNAPSNSYRVVGRPVIERANG
jgi:hypothetical protein